jgi:hypothetical protein
MRATPEPRTESARAATSEVEREPSRRPSAGHGAVAVAQRRLAALAQGGDRSGLPGQLKAGVERLSGLSMDGVRVHYNSSKPASLNALAFTQGTQIHLGPGQERHLPHEAWHVVQQMQGRVAPTTRAGTAKVPVNDDAALEREADAMGSKAARTTSSVEAVAYAAGAQLQPGPAVAQCKIEPDQEIDPKCLNVIGEHHSESEARADQNFEIHLLTTVHKLPIVDESQFVFSGPTGQNEYGDLPHLMVAHSLVFARDFAIDMLDGKFAPNSSKTADRLRQLQEERIDRKIPVLLRDPEAMAQIEAASGVDTHWVQNIYDQMIGVCKELDVARAGADERAWSRLLGKLAEWADVALVYFLGGRSPANLREERSIVMDQMAKRYWHKKYAWKIGDSHIDDILRMGRWSVPYNVITRKRFNQLLVAQEAMDSGKTEAEIKKEWKRDGYLVS